MKTIKTIEAVIDQNGNERVTTTTFRKAMTITHTYVADKNGNKRPLLSGYKFNFKH